MLESLHWFTTTKFNVSTVPFEASWLFVLFSLFHLISATLQHESGEGNGTSLQYSCLENPMDGGAWWAAVHGVAKSRTRLKRLSSSSMNIVQSDQFPWKSAPISIPTSKPFLPTYVSKLSSALSFPMDISQSLCFLPLYPNIGFATKGPNNRTSSLLP